MHFYALSSILAPVVSFCFLARTNAVCRTWEETLHRTQHQQYGMAFPALVAGGCTGSSFLIICLCGFYKEIDILVNMQLRKVSIGGAGADLCLQRDAQAKSAHRFMLEAAFQDARHFPARFARCFNQELVVDLCNYPGWVPAGSQCTRTSYHRLLYNVRGAPLYDRIRGFVLSTALLELSNPASNRPNRPMTPDLSLKKLDALRNLHS